MKDHTLTYNSAREDLVIPEYGRHVQELVKHAMIIEDDEERQKFAERIVYLMYQMNAQGGGKKSADIDEKLWKHMFRIADNKLDVKPPEGIDATSHHKELKPVKIDYPQKNPRYRHYGHNVEELVKKALEMEDPAKQKEFIRVIGSYLKLAYRTWNKEHFVSDELIRNDLNSLFKGKVKIEDDFTLDFFNHPSKTSRRKSSRTPSSKSRRRRRK
jgi:hypothetical protein